MADETQPDLAAVTAALDRLDRRLDDLQERVAGSQKSPGLGEQDLAATLARIEAGQDKIQRKLESLQDHSNIVGYLVEQLGVRRRLLPSFLAGPLSSLLGRAKASAVALPRLLLPFLRPRRTAGLIAHASGEVMQTSLRLHWSDRRQAWKGRLDIPTYLREMLRRGRRYFLGHRPSLYTVHQKLPSVAGPRPRVLHFIPNVFVGGSTQLIVDLFDHLGHKYEMQVATSAFPANGVHRGMIIHDLQEPTSIVAMADLLSKFDPDILHVHYWGDVDRPWYQKVFAAAAQTRCRVVESVNTPVAPFVDAEVARYVFVSEYVRGAFGGGSKNETVITPGIDLDRFAAPEYWGPHAIDSIGMVYRLDIDKLKPTALDPLIRTVIARPRTRVLVIGDGPLLPVFLERVIEAGVRENFVFTGYVPYADLPKYYAQFRTFVAPVWQESFGQVTPFAMSMGLAVAGNRVGALAEIIGSDETLGISVEDTAAKILALLSDPKSIVELGARNRQRARALFDVLTMCNRYDGVYEEVLGMADPMQGFPPAEIFARA